MLRYGIDFLELSFRNEKADLETLCCDALDASWGVVVPVLNFSQGNSKEKGSARCN